MTKEDVLLDALKNTLWMARRYASGRHTYAPGMYNETVDALLNAGYDAKQLGLFPDDDVFGSKDRSIWARHGNDWPYGMIQKHGHFVPVEFDPYCYSHVDQLPAVAHVKRAKEVRTLIVDELNKRFPNCLFWAEDDLVIAFCEHGSDRRGTIRFVIIEE